jgi:hypothetical protein
VEADGILNINGTGSLTLDNDDDNVTGTPDNSIVSATALYPVGMLQVLFAGMTARSEAVGMPDGLQLSGSSQSPVPPVGENVFTSAHPTDARPNTHANE